MPPLISVVMPAYNAEATIDEAMDSVVQQHWPHWELLVVDDGSTDDTAQRVRARRDPRIQLLRAPNQGHYLARNLGVKEAQGDWIAYMDADDRYLPDGLTQLAAFMDQHPLVVGFHRQIDPEGNPIVFKDPLVPDASSPTGYQVAIPLNWETFLQFRQFYYLAGLLAQRDALATIGPFEGYFSAEDTLFFAKAFQKGLLTPVPVPVYEYRVYPGSITKSSQTVAKAMACNLQILERVFELAPPEYQFLKPRAYAVRYRQESFSRLRQGYRTVARQLVTDARQKTTPTLWAQYCLPVWALSWLPVPAVDQLNTWRLGRASGGVKTEKALSH
jgi:glycosyltransferase involved in cell wall biosynthesis